MLTFQDFVKAEKKAEFIQQAIDQHRASKAFKMACTADAYDRQENETINTYVQKIFSLSGLELENFTASNAKIASNFFNRCCTQRVNYLLGNGVSFTQHIEKRVGEDGVEASTDATKEALGDKFDTQLVNVAYYALIHGLAFWYVNVDKVHLFKLTEFVPLWDEDTGALRAGIRFWQLDRDHPLIAELYEEDGHTVYRRGKDDAFLREYKPKEAYKRDLVKAPADEEPEVVGESNYDGALPIVPFWGSRLHQSILVGKQQTIDSYDLINSGFANDLQDCSQIYWVIENFGGMTDQELEQARDRLMLTHMLPVDTSQGGKVTPHTQEVPYQARKTLLDGLRAQIYEDFAVLDVHTVAAGATNDHIDAAYQPVDDAADDLEAQTIDFVQQVLRLMGIEDTPTFKRNKISNQMEQTQMVMLAGDLLDAETKLQHLPWLSPDEIPGIMARRDAEGESRFQQEKDPDEVIEEEIV